MFEDSPDSVLPDLMTQNAQLTKLSGKIFLDYEIKNIGQALALSNFIQFYYSNDDVECKSYSNRCKD